MGKPTLTVCIIARDEEENIKRAIASVRPYATEILVVDTGSTDNTATVAASMGATVLQFRWIDDFSAARNFALDHANGEWVLMLDADEALRASTAGNLNSLLADRTVDAYRVRLVNISEGTETSSVPITRLFRNKPSFRYHGAIHEQIVDKIIQANGRIRDCALVVEHYGYNEAENIRKSRRERNLRLLERAVQENPDSAYLQLQLGTELVLDHDYGRAEWHLDTAVRLSEGSVTAARAAHRLAQLRLERARLDGLWGMADQGKQYRETKIDSHMWCTRVALAHGDHLKAAREFELVQSAGTGAYSHAVRTPDVLGSLKASILWASGQRTEALAVWQETLDRHPSNERVADQLVRHRVLAEGLPATIRQAREGSPSAQYLSAVVGALLRARELDMAGKLACLIKQRYRYVSANLIYGLAYSGDWLDLDQLTPGQKVMGTLALSTAAVWFQRPDLLERTLQHLPESWRVAFESVFWGKTVPPDAAWAVDRLMVHWADVGCLELLRAGAASLAEGGGLGRAAWLLWRAGCVGKAIEWALEDSSHPDALEVLGLVAFENGDYALSGSLLTTRIARGPARVQVYDTAARALEYCGERDKAVTVRERGRCEHPWSQLLRA